MSGAGVKTKSKVGGGAPPLASALEGPRRAPPNGGHPRNAPEEVPEISNRWVEVEFGSLFQFIRNGMSIKQDKSGRGLPVTRIETIADSEVDPRRVGFANLQIADCNSWILEPGDILFSHINSVSHIGKCAVYRGLPDRLVHGMNLLCLRCDPNMLEPEFAKYLIRSQHFRTKLSNFINKAVNQASVSIGNIRTILVSIPPLPEQRRIAEVLDKVEEMRTRRRAAIAHLSNLANSTFLEIFGDPITNPMGWQKRTIKEIGNVITGNTPPRANPENYGASIEWIKSDNINSPDYYLTQAEEMLSESGKKAARIAPVNSILVTCIAGSPDCIGNAAMANREVAFNQQINALVPYAGNPHFFYIQILVGKRLIQDASTNGMKGIVSKGRFEEVRLCVPPENLQHVFAQRVLAIEKLKTTQLSSLFHLDDLFASLQHLAFRGEL